MSVMNRGSRRVRTSVRLAYAGVIHDLEGEATTIDLSVKGCRASCQSPPPVGTKLHVSIYLPDLEEALSIELAMVRWVKQTMIGFRFCSMSSPHRERLQQWIMKAPYGQSQRNRMTSKPVASQRIARSELPQCMKVTPVSLTSPPSTQQTILVVDNEQVIAELCASLLKQAGFSVLVTTKSSEALRICKEHSGPIHLLLTDVIMHPAELSLATGDNEFPQVHGHELAVRALRMRKGLRVILMSGNNVEQDLAGYGISRGMFPALSKPSTAEDLVPMVRAILQGPAPSVETLTANPPTKLVGEGWYD